MKNSIFARFARAVFIFGHLADVLVLSTTWNDLFCSRVDDVSIWWQMFNFVLWSQKLWLQFNSRKVRTHFASAMALNYWEIIAETRGYIFRWRSRCRRGRVCLSSLIVRGSELKRFLLYLDDLLSLHAKNCPTRKHTYCGRLLFLSHKLIMFPGWLINLLLNNWNNETYSPYHCFTHFHAIL